MLLLVPKEGTVNLETWDRIGNELKTFYSMHGPAETFSLWHLFRNALHPAQEATRLSVLIVNF